jgi:hypothetical protein
MGLLQREEQQQMLQTQQATIVRQQKEFESKFAEQQKQIEALTATVQKVSAQIQMNKPAPRVAADTH